MSARKITSTKYADLHALQNLGLYADIDLDVPGRRLGVVSCLDTRDIHQAYIGILSFLNVVASPYDDADHGQLTFRLGSKDFSLTFLSVNRIFGFREGGERRPPHNYREQHF